LSSVSHPRGFSSAAGARLPPGRRAPHRGTPHFLTAASLATPNRVKGTAHMTPAGALHHGDGFLIPVLGAETMGLRFEVTPRLPATGSPGHPPGRRLLNNDGGSSSSDRRGHCGPRAPWDCGRICLAHHSRSKYNPYPTPVFQFPCFPPGPRVVSSPTMLSCSHVCLSARVRLFTTPTEGWS